MTMNLQNVDWKKVGKKFLIAVVEIVAVGTIAYFSNMPLLMGLVPIVEALRNAIKHSIDPTVGKKTKKK